ncbi:hypothetical protein [Labilibacter marinus]|uniref:hypothetical protein n=1 Tax=Labilibacter marinus TaxID=1477105 RepID=UPI00082EFD4C|nr:hypothetical protein [Labilibacter marinus]
MKTKNIDYTDENVNIGITLGSFTNKFIVNGEQLKDEDGSITNEKYSFSIDNENDKNEYIITRSYPLVGTETVTIFHNGKIVLKLS